MEIAKDCIQKLDHLNKTTDIYQTQQMCFNHFLVSALGIIFLAVALAPAVYRSVVRDEFHMALDLVRGLSEKSYVSKRLWKIIRGLRQAGFTLGLTGNQRSDAGNIRSANNLFINANGQGAPQNQNNSLMSPPNSTSNRIAHGVEALTEGDAYLNTGTSTLRNDVSMFPMNGSQITLELNNIFTAMDTENGFGMSESLFDDGNLEREGGDPRRVDLAQLWNTFDYMH